MMIIVIGMCIKFYGWLLASVVYLLLQLQRNSAGSINNPKDKLTFSPGSPSSESINSDEIEDADYSWVDRLGKWPKRIM